MKSEEETILEVIKAARTIQDFLWSDMNVRAGLEEFKRILGKRVIKIDEIQCSNPHWKTELKKRLLQIAAISVWLINRIDNNELNDYDELPSNLESNLPQYSKPIGQ